MEAPAVDHGSVKTPEPRPQLIKLKAIWSEVAFLSDCSEEGVDSALLESATSSYFLQIGFSFFAKGALSMMVGGESTIERDSDFNSPARHG